jgi:type IV pilus assembly protein PilY1
MNRPNSPTRITTLSRHLLVALAGITFPNTPLQTGSGVPPNVMMLFDNSGSMYWTYLYIHTSSGAFPTIAVPAGGATGSTGALTSTNTGDETSEGSFNGVTDAYGNNNCSNNGSSGTTDTANACVQPSINNDKYMVDQTYATNGLYYNPAISYTPWHYPDGTQNASTPYTAAAQSHNFTAYNWTAVDSSTKIALTTPTTNLLTHTETYYVPKTTTDTYCTTIDTTKAQCYYRYQILGTTEFPSAAGKIYQSQLLQLSDVDSVGSSNSNVLNQTGVSAAKNAFSTFYSITVPTGATVLTVTSSGGTGNAAWLFVRQGTTNPTTTTYTCRSNTTGTNSQTCTINTPTAGTYKVGIYGNGAAVASVTISGTVATPTTSITKGALGVGCNDSTTATGFDWRFCNEVTGTTRSEAAEEQNFANWYSFYDTRIKTAKASLSAAFSALTTIPRVGFRDIWDRFDFDIPVGTDDGLFEDKAATTSPVAAASVNKTNWFKTVMGEIAYDGTPLRDALNSVGEYYSNVTSKNGTSGVSHSDTGATGPYGPESGTAQLTCRQNFTILSTDGYWNESFSGVSGDANSDDTAGPSNTSADGKTTLTYSAVSPYVGPTSDTLADVAEHYWKTDLRTDLANKVPTSSADPAFWQHMTTFTISIGAAGTLNPATVLSQIAAGTTIIWPVPVANGVTTIDDLFHAAVNGHGSFVVASDPVTFVNALSSALAAINQRTSASANVSTNSVKITTSSDVYEADFVVGAWTGDLFAFALDSTTGAIAANPAWQASKLLPPNTATYNALTPLTYTQRKIFTLDPTLPAGSQGATFPTAAQTSALGGTAGANYIMGDQSNEVANGGSFRSRSTVLGDMIDSSPVFVPAATSGTPNLSMLYVGANDGMMHAFNANTGQEVFAYIPGGVNTSNLKTLENPLYVHQYSVDGAIAVSTKAQTIDAADSTGKNILVGTLGRGGNTVYALDVTDPANFGASKVLWEYTDTNMGNSLGEPVIAKLNIKDTGNGTTGVIIPNGYNSSTGTAALIVLNIRTGALIATLDSKVGNTTTITNGMATPTGWDADLNGTADLVYAGDLQGNVWEFDISSSTASNWKPVFGTTASPKALYTAEDSSATPNRQPITSAMDIGLNPSDFTRWVFFGTGQYLTSGDPSNDNVQTWYGLQDPSSLPTPSTTPITTVTTRNSTILRQRTVTTTQVTVGTPATTQTVRYFSPAVTGDMTGLQGWYVDLVGNLTSSTATQGERIVSDTELTGNVLLAASIIPSTDACDIGGDGFINAVNPFTGAALTPAFFDIDKNGQFNTGDEVKLANGTFVSVGSIDPGVGMPSLPSYVSNVTTTSGGTSGGSGTSTNDPGLIYVGGTGGGSSTNCNNGTCSQFGTNNATNAGRISWREILQGN